MKTASENQISYICLENKLPDFGGSDYNESFKLHYDHYQKILKAKKEKGLIAPSFSPEEREQNRIAERPMKEGDFVYLSGRTNMSMGFNGGAIYGKPVYGLVKKDDKGILYVQSYKLIYCTTERGNEYTYIPERYYLTTSDGRKSAAYASHKILFSKNTSEV